MCDRSSSRLRNRPHILERLFAELHPVNHQQRIVVSACQSDGTEKKYWQYVTRADHLTRIRRKFVIKGEHFSSISGITERSLSDRVCGCACVPVTERQNGQATDKHRNTYQRMTL